MSCQHARYLPLVQTQNQALRNERDKYQLTQMVKQHNELFCKQLKITRIQTHSIYK